MATAGAVSPEAARLHAESYVIDGHCDILMDLADGTAEWDRDDREATVGATEGCRGLYSLPQWQAGGMTVQFCAIWTGVFGLDLKVHYGERGAAATARALAMAATLHQGLRRFPDRLLLVRQGADIDRAKAEGKVGLLLSMEGGEPFGFDTRLVEAFYQLGLRSLGLTWNNRNYLADGRTASRHAGGLTPLGLEVVEACNALGILLDIAHLHPVGVEELLAASRRPVISSHGYLRDDRLRAEHARQVAAGGGVVCQIFYDVASVEELLAELDRLIDVCGEEHVGIGTDYFGRVQAPAEVPEIGALPALTEAMLRHGYRPERIAGILGGNLRRVIKEVIG